MTNDIRPVKADIDEISNQMLLRVDEKDRSTNNTKRFGIF